MRTSFCWSAEVIEEPFYCVLRELPIVKGAGRRRSSVLAGGLHTKRMLSILAQFFSYCLVCGRFENGKKVIHVVSGRKFSK